MVVSLTQAPDSQSTGAPDGARPRSATRWLIVAARRIRSSTAAVMDTPFAAGNAVVDAYERGLDAVMDAETWLAERWRVAWALDAVEAHTHVVKDVTGGYVKAARYLLN